MCWLVITFGILRCAFHVGVALFLRIRVSVFFRRLFCYTSFLFFPGHRYHFLGVVSVLRFIGLPSGS